jgi:hypothetical protein
MVEIKEEIIRTNWSSTALQQTLRGKKKKKKFF